MSSDNNNENPKKEKPLCTKSDVELWINMINNMIGFALASTALLKNLKKNQDSLSTSCNCEEPSQNFSIADLLQTIRTAILDVSQKPMIDKTCEADTSNATSKIPLKVQEKIKRPMFIAHPIPPTHLTVCSVMTTKINTEKETDKSSICKEPETCPTFQKTISAGPLAVENSKTEKNIDTSAHCGGTKPCPALEDKDSVRTTDSIFVSKLPVPIKRRKHRYRKDIQEKLMKIRADKSKTEGSTAQPVTEENKKLSGHCICPSENNCQFESAQDMLGDAKETDKDPCLPDCQGTPNKECTESVPSKSSKGNTGTCPNDVPYDKREATMENENLSKELSNKSISNRSCSCGSLLECLSEDALLEKIKKDSEQVKNIGRCSSDCKGLENRVKAESLPEKRTCSYKDSNISCVCENFRNEPRKPGEQEKSSVCCCPVDNRGVPDKSCVQDLNDECFCSMGSSGIPDKTCLQDKNVNNDMGDVTVEDDLCSCSLDVVIDHLQKFYRPERRKPCTDVCSCETEEHECCCSTNAKEAVLKLDVKRADATDKMLGRCDNECSGLPPRNVVLTGDSGRKGYKPTTAPLATPPVDIVKLSGQICVLGSSDIECLSIPQENLKLCSARTGDGSRNKKQCDSEYNECACNTSKKVEGQDKKINVGCTDVGVDISKLSGKICVLGSSDIECLSIPEENLKLCSARSGDGSRNKKQCDSEYNECACNTSKKVKGQDEKINVGCKDVGVDILKLSGKICVLGSSDIECLSIPEENLKLCSALSGDGPRIKKQCDSEYNECACNTSKKVEGQDEKINVGCKDVDSDDDQSEIVEVFSFCRCNDDTDDTGYINEKKFNVEHIENELECICEPMVLKESVEYCTYSKDNIGNTQVEPVCSCGKVDSTDDILQSDPSTEDSRQQQILELRAQLDETEEHISILKDEVMRITAYMDSKKQPPDPYSAALYKQIMKPTVAIEEVYRPSTPITNRYTLDYPVQMTYPNLGYVDRSRRKRSSGYNRKNLQRLSERSANYPSVNVHPNYAYPKCHSLYYQEEHQYSNPFNQAYPTNCGRPGCTFRIVRVKPIAATHVIPSVRCPAATNYHPVFSDESDQFSTCDEEENGDWGW